MADYDQRIAGFCSPVACLLAVVALACVTGCTMPEPERDPIDAGAADTEAPDAGVDADEEDPILPPGIVSITPAQGPTTGLTTVIIRGGGFLDTSDVLFGETPAVSFKVLSHGRIRAQTPPRPPGAVDITVRVRKEDELGVVTFDDLNYAAGFTYLAPITVQSVSPDKGDVRGGDVVTVIGSGYGVGTSFVFGDRIGIDPVIIDTHTATIIVPPGKVGKVHVTAANSAGNARLKRGFEYLAAPPIKGQKISLYEASPYHIDAKGGTKVKIVYKANSKPGAILSVRIGALQAASVEALPDLSGGKGVLTAVTPQGSPGPADLEVVFENGVLRANDVFIYEHLVPRIVAVMPGRGAQAGRSWVRVAGSGMKKLKTLMFGPSAASDLKIVDDGLAWAWTPPGKPGVVDVTGFFGQYKHVLHNAFVYFDPASGNLGTWGEPIEHTVNVTVTQRYVSDGGPVQGAWVIVGADHNTDYKGVTDSNGQITFSGPGIKGPLDVSASKSLHTAASVMGFNTENVTLLIRDKTPHDGSGPGPTGKPKQFSPGIVEGRVVGAKKYVQLPMGSCAGHDVVDGHCAVCKTDKDCGKATSCVSLHDPLGGFNLGGAGSSSNNGGVSGPAQATETQAGRFCASSCLTNTDCPTGFECRATSLKAGNNTYHCAPRIGVAQTRCQASLYSFFSKNDDPGPGWIADPDTGKFSIGTRLGDVAIYCRGGYVRDSDGFFVPLAMGVVRNVVVGSGQTVKDIQVELDVPLRRQIHARLRNLPIGDDTKDLVRFIDAKLELGGDGWLPMAKIETTLRTDTLVLPAQPTTLGGPLKGAGYAFYAGIVNPKDSELAPKALAWKEQLHPAATDSFAWWPQGVAKPELKTTWSSPIAAIAQSSTSAVAVGDGGAISVWSGQAWTQQSSPTTLDLRTVWLQEDGKDGWAGGDAGILLRRDALSGWRTAPSPTTSAIIAIAGSAGHVWLLDEDHGLWRRAKNTWTKYGAPVAKPVDKEIHPGVIGHAKRLRSLWVAPDGTVFSGGDDGMIWAGKRLPQSASSAGKLAWKKLAKVTSYRIRSFAGSSSSDVYILGDRGFVAHWDGTKLKDLPSVTAQPLYAGVLVGKTLHAVGGQGAWVTVDASGTVTDKSLVKTGVDLHGVITTPQGLAAAGHAVVALGPYLELPYVTLPAKNSALSTAIKWKTAPGAVANLNHVRISSWFKWPQWDIVARGDLKEVKLPQWQFVGGFNPLPGGALRVEVSRILAKSIDVDRFNYKKLTLYDWTSYAYGWTQTTAGAGPVAPIP